MGHLADLARGLFKHRVRHPAPFQRGDQACGLADGVAFLVASSAHEIEYMKNGLGDFPPKPLFYWWAVRDSNPGPMD
jgi:hypothetical protein